MKQPLFRLLRFNIIPVFFLLVLSNHPIFAQVPECVYSVQCLDTDAHYEYADTSYGAIPTLTTLISHGVFLNPTAALTQSQRVVISVPVIIDIDYNIAPGSELVFTDPEAKLIVKNPVVSQLVRLTVKGSHLHGCNSIWYGIRVNLGGTLVFEQNCFQDTRYGLHLLPGSRFSIYQNSFSRNYYSILAAADNSVLAQVIPIEKGISDNSFSGLEDFIYPVEDHTRPVVAIKIYSIQEITIGSEGVNRIHDYSNSAIGTSTIGASGINIENANVTIQNTQFERIGRNTLTDGGTAINALNAIGQRNFTLVGLGKNNSTPTFEDCESAIQAYQGTVLNVSQCYFNRIGQGIFIWSSPFFHRFDIFQNRFRSYMDNAINTAAGSYTSCRIWGNAFEDNLNVLEVTGVKSAIYAIGIPMQTKPAPSFFLDIYDNQFVELQKPPVSDFLSSNVHLYLLNIDYIAKVHDNNFLQQHNGPYKHAYRGIILNTSSNNLIKDNYFSGVSNYSNPIDVDKGIAGISVAESSHNTIRCNFLENIHEGIRLKGFGCDGTNLGVNSFSGHDIGLLLVNAATRIGPQEKRDNTWNLQSDTEALFDGNPSNNALTLSRFIIETTESPNNPLWASPRTPTQWFKPAFGATNGQTPLPIPFCDKPNEEVITKSGELILSDEFPVHLGYTELQWEASLELYHQLYEYPELRPLGSTAAAFFDANAETNLGKLYFALRLLGQVNTIPESIMLNWEENQVQVTALMEQMAANHHALAQPLSATQNAMLLTQLEAMNGELQTLLATRTTLETNYLAARQTNLMTLNSYLSNVVLNDAVYESNLKTVMEVLIETVASNTGNNFTPSQKSALEAVANQCRYSGGIAVIMARSALSGQFSAPDDELICTGGTAYRNDDAIKEHQDLSFAISPNPTGNFLQISWPQRFESGEMRILNSMGRTVLVKPLANGLESVGVDLTSLPTGVYLIDATFDGVHCPAQRLIKIIP